MLLHACATLPPADKQIPSFAPTDTKDTRIGSTVSRQVSENPEKSGFKLLSNGMDAYAARASLIKNAERSIDVQYYFIRYDESGQGFMGLLVEAANRGVRVRILLDDYYLGDKDEKLLALDGLPNLEIRAFNPFPRNRSRTINYLTQFDRVSRRMHNKSFTVDNQVTIVGGRNIGNEYFDADPKLEFKDLDVLAIGQIVKETSAAFDLYWNNNLARSMENLLGKEATKEQTTSVSGELLDALTSLPKSDYVKAIEASNLIKKMNANSLSLTWADAQLVLDSPDKLIKSRDRTDLQLMSKIDSLFASAKQELIIISPYFIPGKAGTKGLTQLARNEVSVKILTNSASSNNVSLVHAHYSRYRKSLLRNGVELYETKRKPNIYIANESETKAKDRRSATLHAKSFVIDKKITYIGSLNFDSRSISENTEMGVVIYSSDIGTGVSNWFFDTNKEIAFKLQLKDNTINWIESDENGLDSRVSKEPNTTWWGRFKFKILSWIPVEALI